MVWIELITTRAGGADSPKRGQDVAHRGRRGEPHRRRAEPEPARAQPNLVGRLLAGNIGDRKALRGDPRGGLEQQGRLADAGIAADQGRRAGDQAAAERAVELGDAGRDPRRQRDLRVEPDQIDAPPAGAQIVPRGEGRHHRLRHPRPGCSIPRNRRTGPVQRLLTDPQAWQT